jgi:hypothetical protein
MPHHDDIERRSSWGVLRREIQKRSRHKPVRQLIKEIPDVLNALAPCLMMSPLSVAQYLPADQALFDVVIFDEASQITVWDAVGSLARGKQVIIASDPKQMPPTNFFARSDDDPDGDIDIEGDLESILDEMRKVEYICTEEIRAIDKLLSTNGDQVELARHLGIVRLSQFARERLIEAIGE